jgi:hypothetical protein
LRRLPVFTRRRTRSALDRRRGRRYGPAPLSSCMNSPRPGRDAVLCARGGQGPSCCWGFWPVC